MLRKGAWAGSRHWKAAPGGSFGRCQDGRDGVVGRRVAILVVLRVVTATAAAARTRGARLLVGLVVGVVVATVVLYAVFVAILHFWGARYLAAGSAVSVAVFTVLGALCARAMLGNSPTLCGALVAMATLFVLEFGFGRLHAVMSMRSHRAAGRARAWAVMIDGRARPDALRHVGLTAERLHERLRAGGVRHLDDVALAVLEPRGTLTVVRRGESIDPKLLVGIAGLPPGFGDVDTTGGR